MPPQGSPSLVESHRRGPWSQVRCQRAILPHLCPHRCQAGHQSLPLPGTPPAAAPHGARGGPGTSLPSGECPCGVMLTSLSPFKPVPRGMEPSTQRVCRERDVNRCSLQDLCVVSDLTFMSLFFFFGKGSFFHLARISRNICFCPCVEVRNEPKPPPTSPHWQDSPSGISFPFVTV